MRGCARGPGCYTGEAYPAGKPSPAVAGAVDRGNQANRMLPVLHAHSKASDIAPDLASGATCPSVTCILLHGLGAQADDLRGIARDLSLPNANIEFILPQAPTRSVTLNGGAAMPAWFDIFSSRGSRQDGPGIRRACAELDEIIADRHPVTTTGQCRVFVGGFSQGGAVALHYATRSPRLLAGVIALSGYLPLADELAQAATASGRETPVFLSHGTRDNVIPIGYAATARDLLRQNGFRVAWHEYPLAHSVDARVLRDLSGWMADRLGEVKPDKSRGNAGPR